MDSTALQSTNLDAMATRRVCPALSEGFACYDIQKLSDEGPEGELTWYPCL